MMNRKKLFQHILWILIVAECFPMLAVAASKQKEQRYKIAVCDWMILKRQKIGSFQLVHELKGDGVELDMGSLLFTHFKEHSNLSYHFFNFFNFFCIIRSHINISPIRYRYCVL